MGVEFYPQVYPKPHETHIPTLMGDYRYTELSYKITSLISRTCCLGSSTQAEVGMMPFICDSYRNITTKILSIHFNYLFLLLLISLETTTPHVRRCPFIFAVLYTRSYSCPTTSHFMTRCIPQRCSVHSLQGQGCHH